MSSGWRSLVPGLFLALALGDLAPAGLAAAPQVRTPLSVALEQRISNAPIIIAEEEGDFAAQGIDVRPTGVREQSQAWAALIAGQLDVYPGSFNSGFMQAIARGAKLRIVADKGHAAPGNRTTAFMIRQDLIDTGRFHTLKDLRGMRISLGSRGSIGELFVLRLLRDRALLTERDVHFVQVPVAVLPDAVRAKAIDAFLTSEPLVTRLESLGLARAVVTLNDILPRVQNTVVIYGPSLLVRNPGLGQRFMNAYLRGVRRYAEGKTERNIAILQGFTGDDEMLLGKMDWPQIHPDGHLNLESIMQIQAWWVREGWLEHVVSPDQFLEPGFALRAYRTLTTTR